MVERVLDLAIEVVPATAVSLLSGTLDRLASTLSSFVYAVDAESGQFMLSAENESQLGEVIDHLKDLPGLSVRFDVPRVAYRETITRAVDHEYTHKDLSAGRGQFARIKFRIEPTGTGKGSAFVSAVVGGNLARGLHFRCADRRGFGHGCGASHRLPGC